MTLKDEIHMTIIAYPKPSELDTNEIINITLMVTRNWIVDLIDTQFFEYEQRQVIYEVLNILDGKKSKLLED